MYVDINVCTVYLPISPNIWKYLKCVKDKDKVDHITKKKENSEEIYTGALVMNLCQDGENWKRRISCT